MSFEIPDLPAAGPVTRVGPGEVRVGEYSFCADQMNDGTLERELSYLAALLAAKEFLAAEARDEEARRRGPRSHCGSPRNARRSGGGAPTH